MIAHSDNTGTDIALKRAGVDRVRAFMGSIGLNHSHIPNTTRQFFGYLAGVPDWETVTWIELLNAVNNLPPTGPSILNDVQTMASTANDFVSSYSRALQGEFFAKEETLTTFRSILALAGDIPDLMPLGVSAYLKSGSIAFRREHALSLAGGAFIPDRRWVYFSFLINWVDGEGGDDQRGPVSRHPGAPKHLRVDQGCPRHVPLASEEGRARLPGAFRRREIAGPRAAGPNRRSIHTTEVPCYCGRPKNERDDEHSPQLLPERYRQRDCDDASSDLLRWPVHGSG